MADGITLTPEAIAEIEARCKAATPGPWYRPRGSGGRDVVWAGDYADEGEPDLRLCTEESANPEADAAFIAHAREDVPRLLAAAKTIPDLLARIRDLENALTEARSDLSHALAVIEDAVDGEGAPA